MTGLVLAGGIAQLFPVATGVYARQWLTAGRRWILAFGVYSTVATALQGWFGHHGNNNLWLTYILEPIELFLTLSALSCWHRNTLFRLSLRWAIVAGVLLNIAAALFLENQHGFSIASVPAGALIELAAALFTLITLSLTEGDSLIRQDWFWISAGFALNAGAFAVLTPLSAALGTDNAALVTLYDGYAIVSIVAYALIAIGLLMPAQSTAAVAA